MIFYRFRQTTCSGPRPYRSERTVIVPAPDSTQSAAGDDRPRPVLTEDQHQKGSPVFTPEQYRAKAAEYTELAKQGITPDEVRECHTHERSLTMLADNKQWLADNDDKLADNLDEAVPVPEPEHNGASEAALAAEEERILRRLGAALILQWNTLPTELQRELFDNAGSMGELLDTAALRGQIARFLRKRTHDDEITISSVQS
jgi:hypothetical protein